MANLGTAISPATILLGQTGHDTLHTDERDYIETLRQKASEVIEAADVTGTKVIDWALGSVKDFRLIGNTTFSFAVIVADAFGGGANGQASSITLRLRQDAVGSRTVVWPTATVLKWAGGVAPSLTTTATREDWLSFITLDGGQTWRGFMSGRDMR